MFVDLDWPLNASSLLSASAELLVLSSTEKPRDDYKLCIIKVSDYIKKINITSLICLLYKCVRFRSVWTPLVCMLIPFDWTWPNLACEGKGSLGVKCTHTLGIRKWDDGCLMLICQIWHCNRSGEGRSHGVDCHPSERVPSRNAQMSKLCDLWSNLLDII